MSKSLHFVFSGGRWGANLELKAGEGFDADFKLSYEHGWRAAKWITNAGYVQSRAKVCVCVCVCVHSFI